MATRVVPEHRIVICDVCGIECHKNIGKGARKREASLTFKTHMFDMLGDPAADGTTYFDLCDDCAQKLSSTINEKIKELRTEARKEEILADDEADKE